MSMKLDFLWLIHANIVFLIEYVLRGREAKAMLFNNFSLDYRSRNSLIKNDLINKLFQSKIALNDKTSSLYKV